jgi:hypothetical protein
MYAGYFSWTLDTTGAPYALIRSSILVMEPCDNRTKEAEARRAWRGEGENA